MNYPYDLTVEFQARERRIRRHIAAQRALGYLLYSAAAITIGLMAGQVICYLTN